MKKTNAYFEELDRIARDFTKKGNRWGEETEEQVMGIRFAL